MLHTIPGFDSLTLQQMFDMAANHIAATRRASVDANQGCQYGGSGCNAAPFLTEEGKKLGDEMALNFGGCWDSLVRANIASRHHSQFIVELQEAHDNAAGDARDNEDCKVDHEEFIKYYVINMVSLADDYNLNISALASLTN